MAVLQAIIVSFQQAATLAQCHEFQEAQKRLASVTPAVTRYLFCLATGASIDMGSDVVDERFEHWMSQCDKG
jgi:hypothetical protein